MFDPAYPLTQLHPASYNPRVIDEASITRLQRSLQTLGLIKPVIVTDQGTLVAGHQRTRAMHALGYTSCPAFVLEQVNTTDEIRFNQLHNASDLDLLEETRLMVPPQSSLGFIDIPPEHIVGPLLCSNLPKRQEILQLLARYGPWGSIVVTQQGEILVSALYALASKILGLPCKAYVVPEQQREAVLTFFGQSYGRFSYAHLPKTTWGQSLAQKFRLREGSARAVHQTLHSRTYESMVLPSLKKETRFLDFGAGQMDYVKKLTREGYNARGIEFYYRKGGVLHVEQVRRDITALCEDLVSHGRYDLVVCDSVLNSVDSLQAEADVLTCLNALCKPGGVVIFSGRSREAQNYKERGGQRVGDAHHRRTVNFFDEHGFSALFSQGVWRYQKFHTLAEVKTLVRTYFQCEGEIGSLVSLGNGGQSAFVLAKGPAFSSSSNAWGVRITKQTDLPRELVSGALAREFDLPLPERRSYGRSQEILDAWEKALVWEQ